MLKILYRVRQKIKLCLFCITNHIQNTESHHIILLSICFFSDQIDIQDINKKLTHHEPLPTIDVMVLSIIN